MKPPETRYAKADDAHIAYQVLGEGPLDMVLITTWPASNIDMQWEEPSLARFLRKMAGFGRLICFDKRGTGVSDRVTATTVEGPLNDIRAVMDAVGSERAALIGDSEGGPVAMMYSATYPERTSALVLTNTFARFLRDTDYGWGFPPEMVPRLLEGFERTFGTGEMLELLAPGVARDPAFRDWYGRFQRASLTPGVATTGYGEFLANVDLRPILPAIRVPTLVIHRSGLRHIRVGHGRYLGRTIPGAQYVELPGDDGLFHVGNSDAILDEIRAFLTGVRGGPESDRVLATLLFTDIGGSTERAAGLGDRRWRDLLDRHDAIVRSQIQEFRGREIKAIGDGFLATFDGPARAIRCACAVAADVKSLGIEIRAGLHTGEIEMRGDDVGGIAVHIAQRVSALAAPNEVLVSRTVADLVAGSGIEFEDRGTHALKGVPGEWRLFAVQE